MHRYAVLDATADGQLLALRDQLGHYHVVRPGRSKPALGSDLDGFAPEAGFALLASVPAGSIYRVDFEHIDIGQDATLTMFHPTAAAGRARVPGLVNTSTQRQESRK